MALLLLTLLWKHVETTKATAKTAKTLLLRHSEAAETTKRLLLERHRTCKGVTKALLWHAKTAEALLRHAETAEALLLSWRHAEAATKATLLSPRATHHRVLHGPISLLTAEATTCRYRSHNLFAFLKALQQLREPCTLA